MGISFLGSFGFLGGSRGATQTYQDKVLALSPIAYWPLTEASGTTATALVGTNGTYARDVSTMGTGAGPIAGQTAPVFDGTNDFVNIYSAALNTAMSKTESTIGAWFKVSAAGIWTDGAQHQCWNLQVDGNNFFSGYKSSTNNYVTVFYKAGATSKLVNVNISPTGWYLMIMTVSKTADQLIAYGAAAGGTLAQIGTTQTGLGTWAGNLASAYTNIGAVQNTPTNPWSGQLAHVFIVNSPLTLTQLQTIML